MHVRITSIQIVQRRGLRPISSCNRVLHMGYMNKDMDCGTRQIFGAFRRHTF